MGGIFGVFDFVISQLIEYFIPGMLLFRSLFNIHSASNGSRFNLRLWDCTA